MFVMAHAGYLREKARSMRVERQFTIDELAERLALSRSTIYYWVRDLPIPGSGSGGEWPEATRRKGTVAMQRKYRLLREAAYAQGMREYEELVFWLQYHADQDLQQLREFWAAELVVEPGSIRMQRKSNSNQLAGRTWRSRYGVLTVRICETPMRARVQAWMDCLRAGWQ
jgi:excisionase family DNA binding protein